MKGMIDMEQKNFWLSQYNSQAEVIKELSEMKKKIKIYDTTLRDGEQSVGVSMNSEDKLTIAKALAQAGVDRIEAGFPSSTEEDKIAVTKIVQEVKDSEIWGFARCNVGDIKSCIETGVKSLVCEIGTSPYKMKAWDLTEEVILKRIRDSVSFAKQENLYTAFFAVDATRATPEFLKKAYQTAVNECGADEIVLVDTLGVATPEAMYYLTKLVKSWVDVPVAVHCHNDFGMAVGCTLASLKAGADSAHVTVNGLGEKTGNADIAELMIALHGLYGIETNIKLDKLPGLSKLVESISKVPVSPMKPVVGDMVFVRESGLVVAQLLTYPPSVEGYAPEVVGCERKVVLGKKSGKKSIEYVLEQENIKVSDDKIDELLAKVKNLGAKKKGGKFTMSEVLCVQSIHESGMKILRENCSLKISSDPSDETVIREGQQAEALIVRLTKVTGQLMDALPNLKIIGRHGIGVDNIDVEYATKRNILVINVPGEMSQAVAEHAFAMLLCLNKNFLPADAAIRAGCYQKRDSLRGGEMLGKVLGIIGMGRTGKIVAKIAKDGFGMRVVGYDPWLPENTDVYGVERKLTLEEMLPECDMVSLHVPLSDETHNLFNKETFSIMKQGSLIVNVSRGGIINEDDLYQALIKGKISGAGLDVFSDEPPDINHPLFALANIVVTPHNAGMTAESVTRMSTTLALDVVDTLSGKSPRNPVNSIVWNK
ncbi:homocitrate synthase [Holotrichia oblita]|nr:homocitrate synthase [Holotrichia oblita]